MINPKRTALPKSDEKALNAAADKWVRKKINVLNKVIFIQF